jgi:hypothetical protein
MFSIANPKGKFKTGRNINPLYCLICSFVTTYLFCRNSFVNMINKWLLDAFPIAK